MIRRLLSNHVLVNLAFVLVLVVGAWSYLQLPRQQDPTLNFNWIVITTLLPGASALDVEKKVTDPIEDERVDPGGNHDAVSQGYRETAHIKAYYRTLRD